jgi:hypothetical protein
VERGGNSATYFSTVFGALSANSSITSRPMGSVPMETSRKTRGRETGPSMALAQLLLESEKVEGSSFELRGGVTQMVGAWTEVSRVS